MVESVGGYDYEFVTNLPEDLTCVVCHFALKNPVQLEDCGHRFCKECFDQMKQHAMENYLELSCPLDRQQIPNGHVFKDKATERTILNLSVKCHNFGEECTWIGELREALNHEAKCPKNTPRGNEKFVIELQQILKGMAELAAKVKISEEEIKANKENLKISEEKVRANEEKLKISEEKVKANEQKLVNKDNEIEKLQNEIANQKKHGVNQNKEIKKLQKRLHNSETKMIIPNINNEENYTSLSTAFQWKFNVNQVRSGNASSSPPFYNVYNAYCFTFFAQYKDQKFLVSLHRYRGKYDHDINEISGRIVFEFVLRICGKFGVDKQWEVKTNDRVIPRFDQESRTGDICFAIDNSEISSLTVAGFVHMQCFFK